MVPSLTKDVQGYPKLGVLRCAVSGYCILETLGKGSKGLCGTRGRRLSCKLLQACKRKIGFVWNFGPSGPYHEVLDHDEVLG